jgi:hypothetical protein
LRAEYIRTIAPARARAAETLKLERTLSRVYSVEARPKEPQRREERGEDSEGDGA